MRSSVASIHTPVSPFCQATCRQPRSASLEQNYLPIGNRLRVAGVLLHSSTDGKHFDFEIVIPASYKIIARDVGTVMGVLDGERYEGKERFLSPGTHTFVQTSTGHDLVVFWAQAVDRHFRPTGW